MVRDSTSCTNMSAVSTPMPITRASSSTMTFGPFAGALRQALQPRLLKLADLFLHNLMTLQIPLERGQRVWRDWLTLGRA